MGERTESQICSIKRLITKFTDGKSGETTDYVYDCQGNTMSVLVSSESGTLLKQLTGDVEKTKINGRNYTIENGTDENDKEYVDYGGSRITTTTDSFGRTDSVYHFVNSKQGTL